MNRYRTTYNQLRMRMLASKTAAVVFWRSSMKKMLCLVALAAWSGSALLAQNIIGSWQGTLKAGPRDLKIVIKIAMVDDRPKATLYTVDQPSPPLPASSFTRDGSSLKMSLGPFTVEG